MWLLRSRGGGKALVAGPLKKELFCGFPNCKLITNIFLCTNYSSFCDRMSSRKKIHRTYPLWIEYYIEMQNDGILRYLIALYSYHSPKNIQSFHFPTIKLLATIKNHSKLKNYSFVIIAV